MAQSSLNTGGWRIGVLIMSAAILMGILGVRLVYLQTVRHGHYINVAEAQRKRASELSPHRGIIYMSEGLDLFPVASNDKGWITYAVPRDMDDPHYVAREVAPALFAYRKRQDERTKAIIERTGQLRTVAATPTPTPIENPEPEKSEDEQIHDLIQQFEVKFDKRTDPYEPILRPHEILDEELRAYLEEKHLPGIVLEEQEIRIYPDGELAAHAIGYVGFEESGRVGRYGVEGFYDSILRGDLGWLSAEKDNAGNFIGVAEGEFRPAKDGADIVLTLDRVVQSFAEEVLKNGVEKYGAERGSIIVMDPEDGAILGMATYPTFDPNTYYAVNHPEVQTNPVVSDLFEPGSILKPVIMSAAIEEGLVEPNTTFTDSGPVKVAEYTIDTFDSKHHGVQTMTQVLEQSNNIGMVWLGQQMGAEMIYDYLRRFGLGERTAVELDGETQTNLPEPNNWNITTVATASFGQGVALTPLQALNAINAIANDGMLMQPRIVSRIREGLEEKVTEPAAVRQVVSKQTADKVSAMMVSVIENGVAGLARVPGYYMAGKTGTAQVSDETGKYSKDRKIISFVGFGPVENPRFSILIKLDNPAGLSFASGTAAPMFRDLSEKLLNYYQIPPSYDETGPKTKYQVPN
ncbi:MAG: penicillin-binding protein 2 [Candidatus Andersenbacteria bacterium]|nr:penicillin-binding protein 2 [Candidatus Andersenbacteria bacterium]MBI3250460.1 penicillin-binding protein 2 [Candidatus Andersenbacteria bacterium]